MPHTKVPKVRYRPKNYYNRFPELFQLFVLLFLCNLNTRDIRARYPKQSQLYRISTLRSRALSRGFRLPLSCHRNLHNDKIYIRFPYKKARYLSSIPLNNYVLLQVFPPKRQKRRYTASSVFLQSCHFPYKSAIPIYPTLCHAPWRVFLYT